MTLKLTLAYDPFDGEGIIREPAKAGIRALIAANNVMAVDVLSDWIIELQALHTEAYEAMAQELAVRSRASESRKAAH